MRACVRACVCVRECVCVCVSTTGDVANPWMRQPGPEPEDGWAPSNFTVVTAMFDIGRKDWPGFRRNYSKYLSHMTHVMQLRTNIIAFVDSKAAEAARRMRSHFGADKTEVVEMRLQDLPYFRHRERMQEIMDSEEFRRDNPLAAGKHPEATYVEYDIVTLSKPFFLDRATRLDPFNSSYFVWLDGGYAHSDNVFPDDGVWRPKDLFEHSDKVTMIERKRGVDFYRNHKDHLHKMEVAVLNGGFIGGGKAVLQRLYAMSEEVVADWLVRGVVDDDQSLIMAVYYKDPSMFRLVRGDWHDAFRLFHRPK